MAKMQERLDRWSRTSWVVGFLLTALLGGIDYLTGPELSFSIFYLIPISVLAWRVGRRAGIVISIASAASWLAADLLSKHPYAHPTIPYWSTVVRQGSALAGFVWVARDQNDSTGQTEALLLNQYVAEAYRGQGLGRRLMEAAEEWARGQKLPRISLAVGVGNTEGESNWLSATAKR